MTACTIDVSPLAKDVSENGHADDDEIIVDSGTVVHRGSTPDGTTSDKEDAVIDRETYECLPGQQILTDEVSNARDLGGTPIGNEATVRCGMIFRGPMLVSLTQHACNEFTHLGIRTVIDLRTSSELNSYPEANCTEELARVVRAPLPTPYAVSPDDYIADLYATDSMAIAFRVLGDESAYPIYIHCVYGRDRAGVLAAVILLTLGATRDRVLAEYQLSKAGGITTYPVSMNAVLDEIDRIGGVETYLSLIGISKNEIASLRSQMISM